MPRSYDEKLKELQCITAAARNSSDNDYRIGVFNGLELALAIMEEREPKYLNTISGGVNAPQKKNIKSCENCASLECDWKRRIGDHRCKTIHLEHHEPLLA